MNEEKKRQEAVRLYNSGNRPSYIARQLNRSRKWVYKWIKRAESCEREWYKDRPKIAVKIHNKTEKDIEEEVIQIRKELMNRRYSQIGADAINWELQHRGRKVLPIATINRIIKRNGLVIKKKKRYESKGKDYPNEFDDSCPNSMHQVDLVGPRFLKSGGRFYSLNVIDIGTHRIKVNIMRNKQDKTIGVGLINSWKKLGIPDYIQIDNQLSFYGSNRYPHSLRYVLRLCLEHNIEPIFIPLHEPWRNGVIEHFQDVFDKKFFRAMRFSSYEELCKETERFEKFHDDNHHYSCLNGKVPNDVFREWVDGGGNIRELPAGYRLPEEIEIVDGNIHFIRFIRSDRKLNIFNERFIVKKGLIYEYVEATICTDIHRLIVRHDGKLEESFEYILPKGI